MREGIGETLVSLGDYVTDYSYTGEMSDQSWLVNLRARYYDPSTGRFVSRDTWAGDYQNPVTMVKWLYANASPVMYTDPSGYQSINYDRDAAAKYALDWATKTNFFKYGFRFYKSDCTNFVSQALKAGGFPEDSEWFFKKAGLPRSCNSSIWPLANDCGLAWALTDNLYNYLTIEKGFSYTEINADSYSNHIIPKSPISISATVLSSVQKGDVVFYRQEKAEYVTNGGLFNHAAFVVGLDR